MAFRAALLVILACVLTASAGSHYALAEGNDDALTLLLQPAIGERRSEAIYQPLADYLLTTTGIGLRTQAPANLIAHWETVRRNNYDFVLDAPHFTDYRVRKFGFHVLAKAPNTESFSLITRVGEKIIDPGVLANRRVAALGLPSVGVARLYAMFPNTAKQPRVVEIQRPSEGMQMLLLKQVEAALLPTSFVARRAAQGEIAVVLSTEPAAPFAVSASSRVPSAAREAIRQSLLRAHETDDGRAMLQQIGIARFEPASADTFSNQGNVLKSFWGY